MRNSISTLPLKFTIPFEIFPRYCRVTIDVFNVCISCEINHETDKEKIIFDSIRMISRRNKILILFFEFAAFEIFVRYDRYIIRREINRVKMIEKKVFTWNNLKNNN